MTAFVILSSSLFSITGSGVTASVQVWGAGGNGNYNGGGGSGAAWASASLVLTGSTTYSCSIAGLGGLIYNPKTTSSSLGYNPGAGDSDLYGLSSSFTINSSGTVLLAAVGGSQTGIISHQLTQSSGSSCVLYMQGGLGGVTVAGNADGCGGGSAGGFIVATGTASLGSPGSSDWTIGDSRSLAANGATSGNSGGSGGNGSYYDSGPNQNRVVPGQNGAFPGGGGGGDYLWNQANSSGLGAGGQIIITF